MATEEKEKVHWTKRPENKAKLASMVKKSVAAKKAIKKNGAKHKKIKLKPPAHDEAIPQDTFAYALGYVECWIQAYASSAGVPSETLASRLGQILHSKSRR